jgi:hypothetical protein
MINIIVLIWYRNIDIFLWYKVSQSQNCLTLNYARIVFFRMEKVLVNDPSIQKI